MATRRPAGPRFARCDCQHLGIGAKTGSGAAFAKPWQSDRAKTVDYLRNDLELTAKLAEVLGVLN